MQEKHKHLGEALLSLRQESRLGITFIGGTDKESFLSYQDLCQAAFCYLGCLQAKGLQPGDELVFQVEDNQTYLTCFWACILGGIRPIPLAVTHHSENGQKLFRVWEILNNPYLLTSYRGLSQIEKNCEKSTQGLFEERRIIFLEEVSQFQTAGQLQESSSKDIAFIQFSSGSTGQPKGITLTHRNLLTNLGDIISHSQLTANDQFLSWMPLTHDMGLIGFHLTPLLLRAHQYLMPTEVFVRRPSLWLHKITQHRISVTSSPNFGYRHCLNQWRPQPDEKIDLTTVRLIFNGAEPISGELCRSFLQQMAPYGLGPEVMFTVYGLAEASLAVTFPEPGYPFSSLYVSRTALGLSQPVALVNTEDENGQELINLGRPVSHCQVGIMSETHAELGEGIIGYVCIKGDNVTAGYYNHPGATQQTIREGWLNTGDLGFLQQGNLYLTGRAKDVIFVNGQNVYAHDLERVAEEMEGIETGKIAACGIPDDQTGADRIVLFVLYKNSLENFHPVAHSLKAHIVRRLGLEVTHVVPVKSIPKTTSGKIKRYLLGEYYHSGLYDAVIAELNPLQDTQIQEITDIKPEKLTASPSAQIIQAWIVSWLSSRLQIPEAHINPTQSFAEHGVTSLIAVELARDLGQWMGHEIETTVAWSFPNIQSLSVFLATQSSDRLETPPPASLNFRKSNDIAEAADLDSHYLDTLTEAELAQLLQNEVRKN